jgi:Basic region leucine zipper
MNEFDSMFLPGGGIPSGDAMMDFNDFTHTDFTHDLSGNTGTISPHELMRQDSLVLSNPPSTAFPNLSTPDSGYLESPALASSGLNTSPMDDALLDGTLNFGDLDAMPPLFPQTSYDQFAQLPSDKLQASSSFTSVNSRPSTGSSPMVRQKSSPGRPPAVFHARKFSDTAGVNKPKSRKYLPEIQVDSEDDKETAKRKKNTAAARKSRQRKMEITEQMEAEIQRLRGIIYRMGGNPDEDD